VAEELVAASAPFEQETDKRLFLALRRRLLKYEPFRSTAPEVRLNVTHGTVQITGRVRTLAMKEIVGYLCRRVDGVVSVRNELVSDTELVRRVADALAADPELAPLCIKIDARAGIATLAGDLPSPELEPRAIETARGAPDVVDVISQLTVRRSERPPTAPLRAGAEATTAIPGDQESRTLEAASG
jgi:osmotically-inducible protein OsmY